ncbi:MAG: glycosyltransferase family 4 protein [Desulfurobacteriaceae bacterium]
MKILHVNTEKGWRGGEQQLFYLAKGLSKFGIKSVVACKVNEELERRCKEEGIETIPLSGNQLEDITRISIIGREFDIIHAHSAKTHTIVAFSKKFHKRKVVYTRRVDFVPKNNSLTKLKYKLTDKIVAISECVKNILKENLKLEENKIEVIYSSVDPKVEKSLNFEKVKEIRRELNGTPIIGSVAALTDQKNIPTFIESASFVLEKYPNAKFLVLGEGKKRKELQNLIEKKGLSGKFYLLGFKREVVNFVKAFDVFVLPSDYEGLGSSILIAMLLKVPVVSTDAGATKEIVLNKETGILVPKRNPEKLADGIIKMIEDKALRETCTKNAYRMVKEKFTVDKMVEKYVKLYGEVV